MREERAGTGNIYRSTREMKEGRVRKPLLNRKWFAKRKRGGDKIRTGKEDPTKTAWGNLSGYNRGRYKKTKTKETRGKEKENNPKGETKQEREESRKTGTKKETETVT